MIAVEVDLQKFERAWAGISDALIVTDSEGTIILGDEPRWRGLTRRRLARQTPQAAIERAIRPRRLDALATGCLFAGRGGDAAESTIPFRAGAWRQLHHLCVGARTVNGVLALESHGICDSAGADVLFPQPAYGGAHGVFPTRVGRASRN